MILIMIYDFIFINLMFMYQTFNIAYQTILLGQLLRVPHSNEGASTSSKVHLKSIICSTLCDMVDFFRISNEMTADLLKQYYYNNSTHKMNAVVSNNATSLLWQRSVSDIHRSACKCK